MNPSSDPLARESVRAQCWLLVSIVVAAVTLVVAGSYAAFDEESAVPGIVIPAVVAAPLGAFVQARRHPAAICSDAIIEGQFSSIAWIFGPVSVVALILEFPRWDSPIWAVSATAAAGTIWTLRRSPTRG